MTDPKFANLPGIAYDQPDVYETGDDTEQETSDYYEEEADNESIDKLHISTKDSYNKFKGKFLTGNVDFSDRITNKLRTGFVSSSGDFELAGEGDKETPIQRCHRLQCEMDELMQDITILQNDKSISKDEKESYETVSTVVTTAKKVLDSLRLEQIIGKESVVTSAENEIKNLMQQVNEYKKTKNDQSCQPIKFQNNLEQSKRIAELEHRLYQLENVIGAKTEKLNRLTTCLGTSNLLESVQQLSTKAALLQPAQLDLIETRLNNVAAKMDAIVEKGGNSGAGGTTLQQQDSATARDQKILELYDIAKRTEPITQILPDMLNRMQALESLHNYATNFSKIIAEVETSQKNLAIGLTNNKSMLQGVQEAFANNLENITKEIAKLDVRLKAIQV